MIEPQGIWLEGPCIRWWILWRVKTGKVFWMMPKWLPCFYMQGLTTQDAWGKVLTASQSKVSLNDNQISLKSKDMRGGDGKVTVCTSIHNTPLLEVNLLHCYSMWKSLRHKECFAINTEVKVNAKMRKLECYNHLAAGFIQFLLLNGDCWLPIHRTSTKVSVAFTHLLLTVVNILTLCNEDNTIITCINT